ncbi:DUF6893 family small protein [Micromonospora sp. NPDC047620]
MRKLLVLLAGVVVAGMFWKELPALRRYIKIERM